MISGPARIDDLEAQVRALHHHLDVLHRQQEEVLADVRRSVAAALDDVQARREAASPGRDD
jgi:hypothetical protein